MVNLEKHLRYLNTHEYNEAIKASELRIKNDFCMEIASITEFPGMSPHILTDLVDHTEIKGIVFRAFGAGDVSHDLHEAFEILKNNKIPVVVTTQAPNGNSNFQVNEPGQDLKRNDLAIPAFDMSIESQTIKLAWLLAQLKNKEINLPKLKELMTTDLRGEITVLKEQIL